MGQLHLKQEPSFEEKLAAGLDSHDLELQLEKKKVADLEQEIKDLKKTHFDELSAVKKAEGIVTDPVANALNLIESIPAMQSLIKSQQQEITTLAERLQQAEDDKTELAETLEQAVDAAKVAATARDKYSSDLENAVRQLENDKLILADRMSKLKELQALNPKKLQQANKQLQSKNRELNDANSRMKKQAADHKRERSALEQDLAKTKKQKEAFEKTFTQLHEDVISGNVTDVLETRGDWQLCSDGKRFDLVYIVDTKTDVVRPFTRDGMTKARAVPAEMKDLAEAVLIKNMDAAKHLDFNGGQHG